MTKPTKEAQHTPGPWYMDGNGDIRSRSVDDPVTLEARKIVCRSPFKNGGFSDQWVDADAHLIAAAPELLEVVKVFFKAYRKDLSSGLYRRTMENLHPENDHEFLDNVQRLIAKAEGRD